MTRSSPGAKRIAAILGFMADHPGQSFGLTDLVRALKISRATCHALLTGLVEVGYLFRTSDKSYVLGPALVRVGKAAAEHSSALQIAQPEMRALADEYDVVCSAVYLEDDSVVIRERASSVSNVGFSVPKGSRGKLRTALAGPFLGWISPEDLATWLKTWQSTANTDELHQLEESIRFGRKHGYFVMVRQPDPDPADLRSEAIFSSDQHALPVRMVTELTPDTTYDVSSIIAPIFNDAGAVEFVLALLAFDRPMTGQEVHSTGNRLRSACNRLTTFIAGHSPVV